MIQLSYDFHHLESDEKEFQISGKVKSWENIVNEAKKCVMLCSHCTENYISEILLLKIQYCLMKIW
jgi:hypothetical protein